MNFYLDQDYYKIKDLDRLVKKQVSNYELLHSDNILAKENNDQILNDLLSFIDEELINSTFPPKQLYVNDSNYEYRNKCTVKNFSIIMIYGRALTRVHEEFYKVNNSFKTSNFSDYYPGINLDDIFTEFESRYSNSIKSWVTTQKHDYGATFIILSLLERSVLDTIYAKTIKYELLKLKTRLENKEIILTKDEEKFIETIMTVYLENKTITAFKDIDDIKINIYELLSKYNNLKSNTKRDLKSLLINRAYTLGSCLNNTYTKMFIDENILKLMKIIFDKDELNLRNDIMHCNTNKPYDPFDMGFTSIFFQLFLLLTNN